MNARTFILLTGFVTSFSFAQGFVNLGFEAANFTLTPLNPGQFERVSPAAGLPGWQVFLGAQPASTVTHNGLSIGSVDVSILGPFYDSPGIIDGNFTPALVAGIQPGVGVVSASIAQTALVPQSSQSLRFKTGPMNIGFSVMLGGQTLSLIPLESTGGYNLYGAEISGFAGQVEELRFISLPVRTLNTVYLDSIQFSPIAIPEPSTWALLALGSALLWCAARRRRKYTPVAFIPDHLGTQNTPMKTPKNSGVRALACAIGMSLAFSITCRAAEGEAPVFTAQPSPQTAALGGLASISVSATGTLPLNYRWLRNGISFTNFFSVNSNTSALTFDHVQFADAAIYRVVITNLYGSSGGSFSSSLQVVQPPTNESASAGGTVVLAAKVAGGNSPSYQWRFSGTNLPDATSTNLILTNVQPNQAGTYTFVTTHSGGTSKAFDALLTITELDTDGDGIPDEWEVAHGLNKNSSADADLDPDGDRLSNLEEYIAGTNPTNSASVLKFERITTAATTTLEFVAVSNKTYTIQSADILPAPMWTIVADVVAASSNRLEIITNLPTTDRRFYRLITPGQP